MSRDTRLWMYREGEARLFDHPDDVPEEEGWRRFPPPPKADEEQQLEPSTAANLSCMSRSQLMQEAANRGVGSDISWTKAQLRGAIIEAMNDERT